MFARFIYVTTIVFACATCVQADISVTDSRTPAALAVGTPNGTYALSDLDTYNPYNGSLNIHVPVYHNGGRGDAGYSIGVVVQLGWQIVTHFDNSAPNGDPSAVLWVQAQQGLTLGNKWLPLVPLYSPGVVVSRYAIDTSQGYQRCQGGSNSGNYSYYLDASLTRLTFVGEAGTEHEMVDESTNGNPLTWYTHPPGMHRCRNAPRPRLRLGQIGGPHFARWTRPTSFLSRMLQSTM